MKFSRGVILAILIVVTATAGFSISGADAQKSEISGWEYHVLNLHDGNISGIEETWLPELNKAGADGWEAVGIAPFENRGNTQGLRVLLKRPKR
ncbi:MAG TPA: DUF4177 domain-containing protein [Planctomycetaceae bacterium]|jgi:hypothetical protein